MPKSPKNYRNTLAAIVAIVFIGVFTPHYSFAVNPDEVLADPVLEQRARDLSAKLRCLVCQNQSIDDSDASLAKDLRILLRKRLVAGDSDDEVLDYLVSRYGEFVLLKPRFGLHTLLLWAMPVILILIGFLVAFFKFKTPGAISTGKLTASEHKRITKLLGEGD